MLRRTGLVVLLVLSTACEESETCDVDVDAEGPCAAVDLLVECAWLSTTTPIATASEDELTALVDACAEQVEFCGDAIAGGGIGPLKSGAVESLLGNGTCS